MNNDKYEKRMENLGNRIYGKLENKEEDYSKWTSKPSYIPQKILYNNLVAIPKRKILIWEFHYDHIKNKYDNKSKLLFRDTDILMYEIKTEDDY